MKKLLILIILITIFIAPSYSTTFTGEVTKVGEQESNRVIDANTKQGIDYAKISIPQKKFRTYTDANGNFKLPQILVKEPIIVNIEKEGYRPFSLTINNGQSLNNPMKIEIAQSEPFDIALDTEILHLGDNKFSKNSANASDFKLQSHGPSYSKNFIVTQNAKKSTNYLVIGSILGLDTKLAHQMGQNKIKSGAYSSPAEVYFNGQKIGELRINGDGQRIKIPNSLIKSDTKNQITIRAGQNLMANHIDYDDFEMMNLSILSE
ncbi:carboxypeptidase-like regulatory domain-containing protein [bacterium]|nr:carboxypeptidase-like regulatory domain-containing protein [bacterium]